MEEKANTTVLRRVVQKKESLKVCATILKGNKVRYKKNVIIRTRHCRFNNFFYSFDLLKLIDYQISRLPFQIVTGTFALF